MTQAYTSNVALMKLTVPPDTVANLITDFNDDMDLIDALFASHSHTRAPTAGDDIHAGHYPSEPWVDYSNHVYYIAETVAAGAAVWRQIWPPSASTMTLSTLTVTSQITLPVGTGTAPLIVTSTTRVANLAVADALTVNGQTFPAIAAKGDIISGSAANTLVKTSAGVDGAVLMADSSQTGGINWAAYDWTPCSETLSYGSATGEFFTFTVTNDKTAKYTRGTWIQLTQGGSVKYFMVVGSVYSSSTTVTIYGGCGLYSLANSAISAVSVSRSLFPANIPLEFVEDGWIPIYVTPSFTSVDNANTYVISFAANYANIIRPGCRLKCSFNGSIQYFIVTASVFSTPNTAVTLFAMNYSVSGSYTICSVCYSTAKAPVGFPLDPTVWTYTVYSDTNATKANPTTTRWYGTAGNGFDSNTPPVFYLPIGAWRVAVMVILQFLTAAAQTTGECVFALSSTDPADNTNPSDLDLLGTMYVQGASGALSNITVLCRTKNLTVATKTAYKFLARTDVSLGSGGTIYLCGSTGRLSASATCAYL